MAKPNKRNKNRPRKHKTNRSVAQRRRQALVKLKDKASTVFPHDGQSTSLWNTNLQLSDEFSLHDGSAIFQGAVGHSDEEMQVGGKERGEQLDQLDDNRQSLPFLCDTQLHSTSPNTTPQLDSSPIGYQIEKVTIPKEPSTRRVLCDVLYLIEQARQLEHHSFNCSGRFYCQKIEKVGLETKIHYKCNKLECSEETVLSTEKKCSGINNLAVLGALSTGSGFSQEEEKFATMGVDYMSQPLFSKCEKVAGRVIVSCTEERINEAIMNEKKLAQECGSIDINGSVCITVIVDGGWCKRTYGHGYNASSGVAVIIGAATQQIIFVGVRNKLCLICNAIAKGKIKQKEHTCFKNWSGASTAMEPDIIVEGINYLEKAHNVRCMKIVGDGDSSTMSTVRERVSFGRIVQKVECANHAVRRYSRALEKLSKDTKRFCGREGILGRKLLTKRIPRLAIGARAAIKNHAVPFNETSTEAVENLKKELRNGPSHVFGSHSKCSDFCEKKDHDPDGDMTTVVEASGLLKAIEKTVNQVLVCHATTLIYNATNNPAEQYMSQFAKTIGGKRVDHSKAGGINRRSGIAALAFQTKGQSWHAEAHRKILGSSPTTPLRKFVIKRKRVHERVAAARKLFQSLSPKIKKVLYKKVPVCVANKLTDMSVSRGGDSYYGDNPAIPDISPEEMKEQSDNFLSRLAVKERDELEQATLGQAENDRWREERTNRLSSTQFKRVASRKPYTHTHNIVKQILYCGVDTISKQNRISAMQHGRDSEPLAFEDYIKLHGHGEIIRQCGLFIDPDRPYLCSSPDALVGENGLVEIKCPFTALETKTIIGAAEKHNIGLQISKKTK